MSVDIHNYERMYAGAEAHVRASAISQRNKDLIIRYRDACLLQQTCGRVRLIRVMGVLQLTAETMKKDLDQATIEDLQRLISTFMGRQPRYSAETLGTYKSIIKRFYTWLANPTTFSSRATPPPIVAWMTSHVRARDKKKLDRSELLLPADIGNAVNVSQNVRDKSLVSNLWETGARIAEIGNLQIKHATKNEVGYILDLNGKTGRRNVLIVSSAPYLSAWLNQHPFKNNPEAPLWVHTKFKNEPHALSYQTIRGMLNELFHRAGITKRIHPHLFRHSRATFVLASGLMTEAQAKAYFGWTPDSGQLATYAHLLASDANNAILRENNLAAPKEVHDELRATKCYRCGELNASQAEYCTKCGAVLDLKKAYEHQQLHDLKDDLFAKMFKLLVEKGMIEEAAREIHDAGLGSTLKRLAQHVSGERNIIDAPVNQNAGPVKENTPV